MEEDVDKENESDIPKDRESNREQQKTSAYAYFSLIKEVSDMTKEPWAKCWEMGIYEFFNVVSFSREYNHRQIEEQKRIRMQYNH